MTMTDPTLCTSAPATGPKTPAIASRVATMFTPMANVRLTLMVRSVWRASPSTCPSSPSESFTSAMSEASTAMSLPTPPMAMPTNERRSAGASFTPSPTMHTRPPPSSTDST